MSPAEMLLTNDMQLTLDLLGSSRDGAIRYLRPHYMLDLVAVDGPAFDDLSYDWSRLDAALDPVVENGILMVFELMGNPGGRFDDFREREQVYAWRDFTHALAMHLQNRYGSEVVEQWYFETSNEPDIHPFWPQSMQAFLNYYDASSEGLRRANPKLRFGGPGSGRFLSPVLKQLLEHCDTGTNYFSGEVGTRIDFISFHVKALPQAMVRLEQHVVEYIQAYHPRFADVPIMNNEADPIGGWGIPYWWRTGAWHAAFVGQSIDFHNRKLVDELGANVAVAAGDNGFLGTWKKRTLTARFVPGDNEVEQWGSSDPGGWKPWDQDSDERPRTEDFYLVKKPSLAAMSMAALLGEERFTVSGLPQMEKRIDTYVGENINLGCLATRRATQEVVLLCYNAPSLALGASNDGDGREATASQRAMMSSSHGAASVNVAGVADGEVNVTTFTLAEGIGDPFAKWVALGSPEDPSPSQFNIMQAHQDPAVSTSAAVPGAQGVVSIEVDLPAPALVAVVLSPDGQRQAPASAGELTEKRLSGLSGERLSLLRWRPSPTETIVTYDVYLATSREEGFTKVNSEPLLDTYYMIADTRPGYVMRVVARNLFGDESDAVELQLR
jgi:L-iduronidase